MTHIVPDKMQAAVIDRFGGIETLTLRTLPVPKIGPEEVLIRLEAAGVGSWDREEREGRYADFLGAPTFPYVLGWDGAGTIVAVGERVSRFKERDRVYAATFPGPSGGGCYAQYAAVTANEVALVPDGLSIEQAGVMGWDTLTALSGVDDALDIRPGETLMVVGASGGVGHMAVQIAKRMGARVLAVASGADGVALARRLGADDVTNGREDDVLPAVRRFAPGGLDAALVTAGGRAVDRALEAVRDGGRIVYPNGVSPRPQARPGVRLINYDAVRGEQATSRLHRLIASRGLEIHVADSFSLEQVAEAHRALEKHYIGKIALRPHGG